MKPLQRCGRFPYNSESLLKVGWETLLLGEKSSEQRLRGNFSSDNVLASQF